MEYSDITADFISKRFPELSDLVLADLNEWSVNDLDPFELFYSVLFKEVQNLFLCGECDKIKPYFDFMEELICSRDGAKHDPRTGDDVLNLIQTGFLEYFWDSYDLYELANRYMGERTKALFSKIATYLNIPTKAKT